MYGCVGELENNTIESVEEIFCAYTEEAYIVMTYVSCVCVSVQTRGQHTPKERIICYSVNVLHSDAQHRFSFFFSFSSVCSSISSVCTALYNDVVL